MFRSKLSWTGLIVALCLSAGVFVACQKDAKQLPSVTSGAAVKTKATKYDPITVTCAGGDQTTLDLLITAGSTGAPAGFSIQWMKKADLDALGGVWPSSDDPSLCKASFSGKAYGNSYALGAGASVMITLGDLLAEFDNGGAIKGNSPECEGALACGTVYAFRAFAHADNKMNRSDFSTGECETAACDESCGRHGFGFWKTNYPAEWPSSVLTSGMKLGDRTYSAEELQSILLAPANGNGLIILSHQLIGAKLNLALGGQTSNSATDIADAAIGSKVVPPVGTDDLKYNTINLPKLVGDLHKFSSCKD